MEELLSTPRPTQPSIPPGSVNEYQLRLGRQWQVWFIPLADERGCAGKTVRSLERTRAIPEHLRGVITIRHYRYTNPRLPIVRVRRLTLLGHILWLPPDRPASVSMHWEPDGGRRRGRRPRKTWRQTF